MTRIGRDNDGYPLQRIRRDSDVASRHSTVKVSVTAGTVIRRPGWWIRHIAINATIGAVAGMLWPFVHFTGYVIAIEAGWTVGDPTVTDDGPQIPIGMGLVVIVLVGSVFTLVNIGVARRAQVPVSGWMPTGIAAGILTAAIIANCLSLG